MLAAVIFCTKWAVLLMSGTNFASIAPAFSAVIRLEIDSLAMAAAAFLLRSASAKNLSSWFPSILRPFS